MKKIIYLFIFLSSLLTYSQADFPEGINLGGNTATAESSKILSQQPGSGTLNYINATALPLSTVTINALKVKADLSTGLLKNGLVQANADPTKINITAGIGIISNFDDPENPTSVIISFPAFTGVTPAYLNTGNITYFAINSSAAIVMQATPFTNIQRRDLIVLGAAIHSNLTTVNLVNNISAPTNADTNQLHDFMEAIGALNVSGNKYSANGANLSLNKSAGVIFKLGVNFANNWKDPHNLTIVSGTALTFRYRTQNGTEGVDITALNPAVYDLANVLTTVPPNRFTIQTVTIFQTGTTRIQYGQSTYATMAEAEAAIISRSFVVEPNIAANGITRAYIILRNNTTSLLNASDAKIIEAQKFGGVASGGVALTDSAIIAALGYTPANDADVVKILGAQTIIGEKIFEDIKVDGDIDVFGNVILTDGAFKATVTTELLTDNRNIALQNKNGTVALTSEVDLKANKALTVRKISTNTTLADSDNGKIILLTASCTVTLPNGLLSGFNCSFSTQTGVTMTYALGGSVTLINNAGTTMAEKLSHTIVNTGTANEYLTAGSL